MQQPLCKTQTTRARSQQIQKRKSCAGGRLTATTKKGSPIITPSKPMDRATNRSRIDHHTSILPTPSTTYANPNVVARVSSSVQAVISGRTATRVPYPVAKNKTATDHISTESGAGTPLKKGNLRVNQPPHRRRQPHQRRPYRQNRKTHRHHIIINSLRQHTAPRSKKRNRLQLYTASVFDCPACASLGTWCNIQYIRIFVVILKQSSSTIRPRIAGAAVHPRKRLSSPWKPSRQQCGSWLSTTRCGLSPTNSNRPIATLAYSCTSSAFPSSTTTAGQTPVDVPEGWHMIISVVEGYSCAWATMSRKCHRLRFV